MGRDQVYLVLGVLEAKADDKDDALLQSLVDYDKQAQGHTGCLVSSVTRDLVKTRTFRILQEWKSKDNFLAFHTLVNPPADAVLTHYEASQFSAPGLTKTRHYKWAKAEQKDLTKTQGKLFFLSIEGRTKHALFNITGDLQFDVTMRFPSQSMAVVGSRAVQSGDQFTMSVFPGETHEFVDGKWNGGYALSYSYGPVTDPKYLDDSAKAIQDKVKSEMEEFALFLKSKGLNTEQPGVLEKESFEKDAVALTLADPGRKYVDLKWPPVQTSIARPFEGKRRVLAWMRPEDYLPPNLKDKVEHIINQVEPADIDQGALGDCWFLAAVAACAESPEQLVHPMFVNNHQMHESAEDYLADHKRELKAGVFQVRLAKHGWWKWNIVDSFLPVQPIMEPGGPCFAKNKQELNEMWVSVLEKCYAKLHGSYVAVSGGDPAVAMSDLTGFPTLSFDWKDSPNLFAKILQHDENGRMLWVSTPGEDPSDYMGGGVSDIAKTKAQKYEEVGLGTGHAYTVLKACEVVVQRNGVSLPIQILQIRNPWGNSIEWNRAWSDNSKEWREYPEVLEYIKHKWDIATPEQMFQDDGSFWMSWDDCLKYFNGGGVCLRHNGWQDVRFKTSFSDGIPEHIVKIKPTVTCQCLAFASQHDRRGLKKDDPRREMCALRVEIVTPAKKPMLETIAQSNNGVFMYANQVVAFSSDNGEEPAQLEAGKEYYIITRQHPGEQKPTVRNRDDIVIAIQTSPGSKNQHCRGISPITVTPAIKESWKYVGYYDMSDEGATVDYSVPCQLNCQPTDVKVVTGEIPK